MIGGVAAGVGGAIGIGINNARSGSQVNTPAYSGKDLETDPTKPPAEGFEWRGSGPPGSKKGNWYHPEKNVSIRNDLDHPPPVKPHWDYQVRNPILIS